MSSRRSAVFLDRDGTLVADPGFLRDPDAVVLLPGVGPAVRRLNQAGYPVIVVTNQSGIARGLVTWEQYHRVTARIARLLAEAGAHIDATYECPHHPDFTGPCPCRKPGLELYQRAAAEHGLDLASSVWIGDRHRDVLPARAFGGRAILLGPGAPAARADFEPDRAADLAGAISLFLG